MLALRTTTAGCGASTLLYAPITEICKSRLITHRQAGLCFAANQFAQVPAANQQNIGPGCKLLIESPVTRVGNGVWHSMFSSARLLDRNTSVQAHDEVGIDMGELSISVRHADAGRALPA